jgi:hypothetical protein
MSADKKLLLQVKKLVPVLAPTYVVLLGLLVSVAIVSAVYNIPVAKFTRDPTVILGGHPFTGIISNIGILFWCFTASILFFSSAIFINHLDKMFLRFLIVSGLLTSLLLLDDLFLFHDYIFPIYFHLTEKVVYLGYLVLISLYFLKFKGVIVKTEYTLLLIACGFFALSMGADCILPQEGLEFLVEDGFKLLGIVTWFIFFTRTCIEPVRQPLSKWLLNLNKNQIRLSPQ